MPVRLATCGLITWLCLLALPALPILAGDCFDSDGAGVECPVDINNSSIVAPPGSTIEFLSGDTLFLSLEGGGTMTLTVGADFVPMLCGDDGGVGADPSGDTGAFNATADDVNNTRFRVQNPGDFGETPFSPPGLRAALADLERGLSNGNGGFQQRVNQVLRDLCSADGSTGLIGDLTRDAAQATLRSLSATASDIKPLIRNIVVSIDSLLASPEQASAAQRSAAAFNAITGLELLGRTPASQHDAAANRERLAALDAALTLFQNATREQAAAATGEQATALDQAADHAQIGQARVRLVLGHPAEALMLIEGLPASDARDQALVNTIHIIESTAPFLTADPRADLDLDALRTNRIDALARLHGAASDPVVRATFATAFAIQLDAAGRRDEAIALLDEAIGAVGDDSQLAGVLGGRQLILEIADLGDDPSAEDVGALIDGLSRSARVGAVAVAFDHFGRTGNLGSVVALTTNLAGFEGSDFTALQLQGVLARIDAELRRPGGESQEDFVIGLIDEARDMLARTPGLDAGARQLIDEPLAQQKEILERLEKIRAIVGDPASAPAAGFVPLAREALAAGRLQLAADALTRAIEELPELDTTLAITVLRDVLGVLSLVNARFQDPTLTDEQRRLGQEFIDGVHADIDGVTGSFFASSDSIYSRIIHKGVDTFFQLLDGQQQLLRSRLRVSQDLQEEDAEANADAIAHQRRRINDFLNEIRQISQLVTRIRLVDVPTGQIRAEGTPLLAEASARIEDFVDELKRSSSNLGESILTGDERVNFDAALVLLDAHRAIRDGIEDATLDTTPFTSATDFLGQEGAGTPFPNDSNRAGALRSNLESLNGSVVRSGKDSGIGPRRTLERQNHNFFGSARGQLNTLSNPSVFDDPDHYRDFLLADNEVDALERRRVQIIFENPDSAITLEDQRETLADSLREDARILNQFGNVSPLLLGDLSGVGGEQDQADTILQQISIIEQRNLQADFERLRETDPQRALGILAELRQRNLTGEVELFFDLTHDDPRVRGPFRATGLAVRSGEVRDRFAVVIEDHGRLDGALLRASTTRVEDLLDFDRETLEVRGFILDGEFVIPATVRPNSVTLASDFQDETTSVVDQHLNLQNAVVLGLTVVVPGKIAGTVAEGTFGALSLRAILGKEIAQASRGELLVAVLRLGIAFGGERLVETATFTGLTRLIELARNPTVLDDQTMEEFLASTGAQFSHDFVLIALFNSLGRVTRSASGGIAEAERTGAIRSRLAALGQQATATGSFALEVGALSALSALGAPDSGISQDDVVGNALTVLLLRTFHIFQSTQPRKGRVSQLRDALARFDRVALAEAARQRVIAENPTGNVIEFTLTEVGTAFASASAPVTPVGTPVPAVARPEAQITFLDRRGRQFTSSGELGGGAFNTTHGLNETRDIVAKNSTLDRARAQQEALANAMASELLTRHQIPQFAIVDVSFRGDQVVIFAQRISGGFKEGPDNATLKSNRDQLARDGEFTAEHVKAQLHVQLTMVENNIVMIDAKPDNFAFKEAQLGADAFLEGNTVVLADGRRIEVDGQRVVIDGQPISGFTRGSVRTRNRILVDGNPVQLAAVIDHGRIGRFGSLAPQEVEIVDTVLLTFRNEAVEVFSIERPQSERFTFQFRSAAELQAKILELKGLIRFDVSTGEFVDRRFRVADVFESGALTPDAFVLPDARMKPITEAIALGLTAPELARKAAGFRDLAEQARANAASALNDSAREAFEGVAERHDLRAEAFDPLARGEDVNIDAIASALIETQPQIDDIAETRRFEPGALDPDDLGTQRFDPITGLFIDRESDPGTERFLAFDPGTERFETDLPGTRNSLRFGTTASADTQRFGLTILFEERAPTARLGDPGTFHPGPVFLNPGGEATRGTARLGSLTFEESAPIALFPSSAATAEGPVFFSIGPLTSGQQSRVHRFRPGFEHFDVANAFVAIVNRQDAQASRSRVHVFLDPLAAPLVDTPRPSSSPRRTGD